MKFQMQIATQTVKITMLRVIKSRIVGFSGFRNGCFDSSLVTESPQGFPNSLQNIELASKYMYVQHLINCLVAVLERVTHVQMSIVELERVVNLRI